MVACVVAVAMGKRDKPVAPAVVPPHLQELVNKTMGLYKQPASARVIATPARSTTPPPMTIETPPAPTVAEPKSTPLRSPELKRAKLPGSSHEAPVSPAVPRMPSFSGASSSSQAPHRHIDTQSTIVQDSQSRGDLGQFDVPEGRYTAVHFKHVFSRVYMCELIHNSQDPGSYRILGRPV